MCKIFAEKSCYSEIASEESINQQSYISVAEESIHFSGFNGLILLKGPESVVIKMHPRKVIDLPKCIKSAKSCLCERVNVMLNVSCIERSS